MLQRVAPRLSPPFMLTLCCSLLGGMALAGCAKPPGEASSPSATSSGKSGKSSKSGKSTSKKSAARDDSGDSDGSDDDEEGGAGEDRRDPSAGYVPTPRTKDLILDDATLAGVLAAARAGCEQKPLAEVKIPAGAAGIKAPLIGVLYGEDGRRRRSQRYEGDGELTASAHILGSRLCSTSDDKASYLHLLVVTRQIHVLNFGIKGLFDNKVFEPQVTGLVYHYDGRTFELDPLEMIERNMGPSDTRNAMAKGIGLDPRVVPSKVDLTMEFYRTAHIAEALGTRKPTRFFRGHMNLDVKDVTTALLGERLKLIGEWYRHNVIDGEVTYQYLPSRSVYRNSERTMIRSTMSTWVLNRLAVYLKDKELQDKGDELIRHYFDAYFNMSRSKSAGKLIPSTTPLKNGNVVEKRWTVASFIAAACNERTDKAKYAEEMDLLMTWAAGHQRADGVIWSPNGAEQYFMPGQFLLSLSYFYRDATDPKKKAAYKEIFDKAFAVYEPNLYNTMDFAPEWHTPYAPAWFTQPLAQMYLLDGDPRYRDLIFAINDRVILAYETNARHQVYPDYDGILAPKPFSTGNNSVTAASLEALTDAAIVARKAGDMERFRRYQEVIKHATTYLLRIQYVPENTFFVSHRERVVGSFKNDLVNTKVWMDSVWHLTSAFMKIHEQKLLDG